MSGLRKVRNVIAGRPVDEQQWLGWWQGTRLGILRNHIVGRWHDLTMRPCSYCGRYPCTLDAKAEGRK